MKKSIILFQIIYIVIVFLNNAFGNEWSGWNTIYSEGEKPNDINVQISFKINGCGRGYPYSFYRINNEFKKKGFINFKFHYTSCEGEEKVLSGTADLEKTGIDQSLGYWFFASSVGDIYDIQANIYSEKLRVSNDFIEKFTSLYESWQKDIKKALKAYYGFRVILSEYGSVMEDYFGNVQKGIKKVNELKQSLDELTNNATQNLVDNIKSFESEYNDFQNQNNYLEDRLEEEKTKKDKSVLILKKHQEYYNKYERQINKSYADLRGFSEVPNAEKQLLEWRDLLESADRNLIEYKNLIDEYSINPEEDIEYKLEQNYTNVISDFQIDTEYQLEVMNNKRDYENKRISEAKKLELQRNIDNSKIDDQSKDKNQNSYNNDNSHSNTYYVPKDPKEVERLRREDSLKLVYTMKLEKIERENEENTQALNNFYETSATFLGIPGTGSTFKGDSWRINLDFGCDLLIIDNNFGYGMSSKIEYYPYFGAKYGGSFMIEGKYGVVKRNTEATFQGFNLQDHIFIKFGGSLFFGFTQIKLLGIYENYSSYKYLVNSKIIKEIYGGGLRWNPGGFQDFNFDFLYLISPIEKYQDNFIYSEYGYWNQYNMTTEKLDVFRIELNAANLGSLRIQYLNDLITVGISKPFTWFGKSYKKKKYTYKK